MTLTGKLTQFSDINWNGFQSMPAVLRVGYFRVAFPSNNRYRVPFNHRWIDAFSKNGQLARVNRIDWIASDFSIWNPFFSSKSWVSRHLILTNARETILYPQILIRFESRRCVGAVLQQHRDRNSIDRNPNNSQQQPISLLWSRECLVKQNRNLCEQPFNTAEARSFL